MTDAENAIVFLLREIAKGVHSSCLITGGTRGEDAKTAARDYGRWLDERLREKGSVAPSPGSERSGGGEG